MEEFEKEFIPQKIEEKWYSYWEKEKIFEGKNGVKPRFSMVLPPPNVTGTLHMGHALAFTIPDVIARYKRMKGYNVMWLPGTDHAGIATQIVVERELKKEGLTKEKLGREEFLKRVWDWKRKSEKRILEQLKKIGLSLDWSRYRFTLDEGLSRAVRKVFVSLYKKGLIYKGNYMVNWCPRCGTALSDLEVIYKERKGNLWYIKYPLKEDPDDGIVVATTRPETMLGDTAVAVNPEDDRYKKYIGKTLIFPIAGREIPVIADSHVEMDFGTGAVKVTPAHDPNDFEMGKAHNLEFVKVIDEEGKMTESAGEEFKGLDRFTAREKVVEKLKQLGLLLKVEDYSHSVGHCQRCDTIVEPLISEQWFVKIKPLAEPAIKAVEDGRIEFIPKNWEKTYFEWMRNIRDWCISRQIWWGHPIPVYYCNNCGETMVSEEEIKVCKKCGSKNIEHDPDVLDTWFSSALWPFSTLGFPDETEDLKDFYPTDLMATGFDIIFFWVARMIMMGIEFMGDIPFKEVLINGLVRDEHGQKMSKTKGNVIDPLLMVEKYGADALRFTLIMNAVPGMDVSVSESRMKGYKAFANKLWNASRYVWINLNGKDHKKLKIKEEELTLPDRWILSRFEAVKKEIEEALEEYRLYRAADIIYHFVWDEYCDWYIELSKPNLKAQSETTLKILVDVLLGILKILHPFMPYITEELWHRFMPDEGSISLSSFPEKLDLNYNPDAENEFNRLKELIISVRKLRTESRIPPHKSIKLFLSVEKEFKKIIDENIEYLKLLTKSGEVEILDKLPKGKNLKGVGEWFEFSIPVEGLIDVSKELRRVEKELEEREKELNSIEKRLTNKNFLEKAPESVVEKTKARREEVVLLIERLRGLKKIFKEI